MYEGPTTEQQALNTVGTPCLFALPKALRGGGGWLHSRSRMKTRAAWLFLAGMMLASSAFGQTPVVVKTDREVLLGPPSKEEAPAWLAAMRLWREECLGRMHYSGAEYDRPELKWTQRSFIQPQMMVEDRYLYDPVAGKYTADRYVDDVKKRYGGIDSVLVWARDQPYKPILQPP